MLSDIFKNGAWLVQLSRFLQRRYAAVLLVSLALSAGGAYYSYFLYKNLRTDIEELLPESAPSVKDLKKASGRFTGLNHLEVVIESGDAAAAKRFQIDVAKRLAALPKDIVDKVKADIREERRFFDSHKSLYIDLKDWEEILAYVKAKKRAESRKAFSLLGEEEQQKDPTYDFKKLPSKYSKRLGGFANFKDDYFQSPDGKTRVVLAFLPGKVTDIHGNQALSDAARRVVDELKPESYAPDMRVGLGGDVQNVVEEHYGLVHDLVTSFIIVTLLVTAVLIVYFRSLGGVMALSLALFTGTALTFGLSFFLVGYLNANTAFLGSIVIGNGINFGIIFLARYFEERRQGIGVSAALDTSMALTARATFTAALAAGLSYGSLIFTNFRGFNQFGVIGALGMVLCWITSFTTMPALVYWLEKRRWLSLPQKRQGKSLMGAVGAWAVGNFKLISAVTLALVGLSMFGVAKLSKHTVESDLSKLRNKESMLHGSGYWGKKTDDIFGRNITPTLLLTDSPEDTQKLFKELQKIQDREGENSPFSSFSVVDDFLPKDQDAKLRVMAEIRKQLTPKILAKLKPDERKLVDELLPDPLPRKIALKDLPPTVLGSFQEANGKLQTIVHVYPRIANGAQTEATGTWNGEEVIRYTQLLREAIAKSGAPAVIAGQNPISADMLSAITTDGPKATLFAFLAVVILVVIMFPRPRSNISILVALCIGVLWMVGVMGWMDWKINFLNFITLPITFGIGVDYAVNVFGRLYQDRKEKGKVDVVQVIQETGAAVVLCSLTTTIGYGSLLISGSQAFVSFGRLAVLGEIACVSAAILSLPALWMLARRKYLGGKDGVLSA